MVRRQRLAKAGRRVRPGVALLVDAEHEDLRAPRKKGAGAGLRRLGGSRWQQVTAVSNQALMSAACGAARKCRRSLPGRRTLASAILCSWYAFCARPRLRLANDCRICALPCSAPPRAQRLARGAGNICRSSLLGRTTGFSVALRRALLR